VKLVDRVRKEPSISRSHEHITGVFTVDGEFHSRIQVVQAMDRGEAWFTRAGGSTARIRRVGHCTWPGCSLMPYLSTSTNHDDESNLENLPRL
jgi:hypothetical protein